MWLLLHFSHSIFFFWSCVKIWTMQSQRFWNCYFWMFVETIKNNAPFENDDWGWFFSSFQRTVKRSDFKISGYTFPQNYFRLKHFREITFICGSFRFFEIECVFFCICPYRIATVGLAVNVRTLIKIMGTRTVNFHIDWTRLNSTQM